MSIKIKNIALSALLILLSTFAAMGQQAYRKPPQDVLDVLNAPVTPTASVGPARDYMLLAEGVRYPPIADLAQPMLRLAGLRINSRTNGLHLAPYWINLRVKKISDGSESQVALPAGARIGFPLWSTDGKHFVFTNTVADGIELWVGETASARAHIIKGLSVNALMETPVQWMPDNRTLLVQLVPAKRAALPAAVTVPPGPNVQESSGKPGPVRTYQDLLKNPYDEALFDYYATAQLALVDTESGKSTLLGQPAIFETVDPAPDGQHILIARVHHPYSYLHPVDDFPKEVEVWDRNASVVYTLASLPLADQVPIEGVPVGPRDYQWRPDAMNTLVWAEALDEGDPRKKVPYRDRVMMFNLRRHEAANATPRAEIFKTEQRYVGMQWVEKDGPALISDYDRDKRWRRTFALNPDNPAETPKVIWSRNVNDRYNDPGTPVTRRLPTGQRAILRYADSIYLSGTGASPAGDRPFLDRLNLLTLKTERIFRSDETSYETFVALLTDDAKQFITRRERPLEPLNYYLRVTSESGGIAASLSRPLTRFPDPTPQLHGIKKQLVTYKRADGVQCSFTLYLPPGYKEGTRLPTVVWAYPLEFTDPATAGQVTGSTQRFTTITGPSHLFFLLAGYAVLDNATMPVVGDPETMNNTYVEQIVMSAKAAIDKAVEMGVTDPERVGVGGHSYGAFMTANLLAHSDLFRAGIARSGAYNRTLTPFGFQSERRTLWEAPELYVKVSPFMYANKINEPILLIHGEADNNTGTFPIQSERLYQAIRGNGGTVRYVTLPLEAHGYSARESTEHTLYEMISWFDKYVKNAPPRDQSMQKSAEK
ncbi:MAG TPA: prolyl oligopeptidase family serine peptidase [Pyrinomonadaceae bacterium]|jgi:dipeptidyl aminopeptidase/acylaminoacyl peptidase|nr:prolyl oligopeptidase family serine peptidase [Pyrinomonadaceae bacterium]